MSKGSADMKPSGVPWFEEVPAHWEVVRLAHFGSFLKGRGIARADITDEGVEAILYGDIYTRYGVKAESLDRRTSEEVALGAQPLCYGDLLLTGSGETKEDIGKCVAYLGKERAYAGGDVIILRQNKADSLFLSYLLNSQPIAAQKTQMAKGEIVVHIYSSNLRDIVLPLPSVAEQRAIAAFLDERTARIDGLMARKKRLVQLLKERRQALITRAVTRGLDPNVRLNPSGVPWLGEVPVGWEVKRLKHISEFVTSGSRGWAEHYADEGAVFIRIGNLDRLSIDLRLDDIQRVDPPTSAEVMRTRALKDDLLISITAFLGTVGIVPGGLGEAYVNQHTALVRLLHERCFPRFVAYWLFSSPAQQQFKAASEGGTKEGMNLQEVRDLTILQPDLETQRRIADHLDEALLRFDALAIKVEAAVERLQEYRSALISAAVTGKVQVPVVHEPLPQS